MNVINDRGEFSRSCWDIYASELQLRCKHQRIHATFVELDIIIFEDGIFGYKLFDKGYEFPFSILRIPNLTGNITSFIFYGSIMSDYLIIACCTRQVENFIPLAKSLCDRMVGQGGSKSNVLKQLHKAILGGSSLSQTG